MTATMQDRTASKRRHELGTVAPGQVKAMRDLDDDTLRALVAATLAATATEHDDVQEHAVMVAASLYRGDVMHAARAARSIARKVVALAKSDIAAGMAEEYVTDDASVVMASRWGTAPCDGAARTTYADLVDEATATAMRHDMRSGVALAMAVRDARSHDEAACPRCITTRPTLAGMTGHTHTMPRAQAEAARDDVQYACSTLDYESMLVALDGNPLASPLVRHSRVNHGGTTPTTTQHPGVCSEVNGRDITAREEWTVRNPGCRAGALTHTLDSLGYVAAMGYAPADWDTSTRCDCGRPARWQGEEYGVTTAPERNDVTQTGQVRSHKPVVSPRKRAGGSTGPTIPVALSHSA